MSSGLARTALSNRIWTGISRLLERRGHERLRAAGAGPDYGLPFTDRVIAALVHLRFQLPHKALAVIYGVDRSTVTRAIHEIRPLPAARGFAVPGEPGLRLPTMADLFACAASRGATIRLDCTEVQVRRPPAGKPGRRAFISGKKKQNTRKATVATGGKGRTLWAGAFRPGRMHDQTALQTEGITGLCQQYPQVNSKVDAGCRGLAKQFPDQAEAPPLKPKKHASPEETAAYEEQRHRQSSERICVEHANAEHKQWRPLQRYLGRREYFDETFLAISGLVSDRAAARQPQQDSPPDQHGPALIAHQVVTVAPDHPRSSPTMRRTPSTSPAGTSSPTSNPLPRWRRGSIDSVLRATGHLSPCA